MQRRVVYFKETGVSDVRTPSIIGAIITLMIEAIPLPKRQSTSTTLNGGMSQKAAIFNKRFTNRLIFVIPSLYVTLLDGIVLN
jgi:hypothetical protein